MKIELHDTFRFLEPIVQCRVLCWFFSKHYFICLLAYEKPNIRSSPKLAREPCFEMFWPLSYYSDVRTKHKQICEWLLTHTTCSIRFTFTSSGNGRAHDPLEHRLTPKSRLRRKHVAKHDTFMMRVLSTFDTMSHR